MFSGSRSMEGARRLHALAGHLCETGSHAHAYQRFRTEK